MCRRRGRSLSTCARSSPAAPARPSRRRRRRRIRSHADAPGRCCKPGSVTAAMCWAHARRKFFDVARLNKAPIAMEAVKRINALFEIERDINGKPPPEGKRVRAEHSRPRASELRLWLHAQRAKLSAHSETAKAIAYSLNRWSGLV